MDKLNFFEKLIDKWVNYTPEKKVSFITGIIITIMGTIICTGFIHYENKITELENDKTKMRNEFAISLNSTIARYESTVSIEREEKKELVKSHIKYVEDNEKQMRNILFYNEKYHNKQVKE